MKPTSELPVLTMRGYPHACSYLPGRQANTEFALVSRLSGQGFEQLLNAGFRRSGLIVYRPDCGHCHECQPIRVVVNEFRPDRSMKRCWQRNQDLRVQMGVPRLTKTKSQLYSRYIEMRHDKDDPAGPEDFLYVSTVKSREIEFYDGSVLVSVAIVDIVPNGLSAVYTYFEPELHARSLGTYAILWQLNYCRGHELPYCYLGYYVRDCRKMNYKNRFVPHEILGPGGGWVRIDRNSITPSSVQLAGPDSTTVPPCELGRDAGSHD